MVYLGNSQYGRRDALLPSERRFKGKILNVYIAAENHLLSLGIYKCSLGGGNVCKTREALVESTFHEVVRSLSCNGARVR